MELMYLPLELCDHIISFLPQKDLKIVRLLNKVLSELTFPLLVENSYFIMSPHNYCYLSSFHGKVPRNVLIKSEVLRPLFIETEEQEGSRNNLSNQISQLAPGWKEVKVLIDPTFEGDQGFTKMILEVLQGIRGVDSLSLEGHLDWNLLLSKFTAQPYLKILTLNLVDDWMPVRVIPEELSQLWPNLKQLILPTSGYLQITILKMVMDTPTLWPELDALSIGCQYFTTWETVAGLMQTTRTFRILDVYDIPFEESSDILQHIFQPSLKDGLEELSVNLIIKGRKCYWPEQLENCKPFRLPEMPKLRKFSYAIGICLGVIEDEILPPGENGIDMSLMLQNPHLFPKLMSLTINPKCPFFPETYQLWFTINDDTKGVLDFPAMKWVELHNCGILDDEGKKKAEFSRRGIDKFFPNARKISFLK